MTTRPRRAWLVAALAVLVAGAAARAASGAGAAAQHGADAADVERLTEAFEHYEAIRVALAADSLEGVPDQAEALAPLAAEVAGGLAPHAAGQLAAADTLEEARKHFGALSMLLVPRFLEADLPGVHGFTCAMQDQPWVQRSTEVENPYFGKAMLNCGSPIE